MLLKDKKELEIIKNSNIYECMSKTQNKENPIKATEYQKQKIKYYTEKYNFYEEYIFELLKAV